MFNLNLKTLPEWEAFSFPKTEEGEEWKWKDTLEAGKKLYDQWRAIFQVVTAFTDTLPEEEDPFSTRQMIMENAYMVAPKIISASGDTFYMLKMENAAIIRFNCRQMMDQIDFAVISGKADIEHRAVIADMLELFKELFAQWASLFTKDEYEDDWKLYN